MKRFLLLSVLLVCCICAKAVIIMNGPSYPLIGSEGTYSIHFDPTTEKGKNFRVDISDNGRLIDTKGNLVKSLTITPTDMIWPVFVKWQSAGDGYIQITQKDNIDNTDKYNVKVLNFFDLDPGYSGEPLILKVPKTSIKQFELLTVSVEEHYAAISTSVTWNIDGDKEQNQLASNSFYFPTMGTKTISATFHFEGTSETKTISTTINVTSGVPDLAGYRILGPVNYGVGGSASYRITAPYTEDDVDYNWSVRFRNQTQTFSSTSVIELGFPAEGAYFISCGATDKRTGNTGTSTSLRVAVSEDGAIMSVDDDLFKANLEGSTLRITPTDKELAKAANKAQYTLSNLSTGTVVSTGYVNKEVETNIDVSALRNGMYVLYIQVDAESMEPFKFMLKK